MNIGNPLKKKKCFCRTYHYKYKKLKDSKSEWLPSPKTARRPLQAPGYWARSSKPKKNCENINILGEVKKLKTETILGERKQKFPQSDIKIYAFLTKHK